MGGILDEVGGGGYDIMCILLLQERAERAGECDRGANRDTLGLGISQGYLPTICQCPGGFFVGDYTLWNFIQSWLHAISFQHHVTSWM